MVSLSVHFFLLREIGENENPLVGACVVPVMKRLNLRAFHLISVSSMETGTFLGVNNVFTHITT